MLSRLHRYMYAPGNVASKDLIKPEESPVGAAILEVRKGWVAEHESGETSGSSYFSINQNWAGFENFVRMSDLAIETIQRAIISEAVHRLDCAAIESIVSCVLGCFVRCSIEPNSTGNAA